MSDTIDSLDHALQAVDRLTRDLIEAAMKLSDRVRATIRLALEHAIARAEALARPAVGLELPAELRRRYDDVRAAAGAALAADAAPRRSPARDADVDRTAPDVPGGLGATERGRAERHRGGQRDTGPQTPRALRRTPDVGVERAVIADGAIVQGTDEGERR